MQAKNLSFRELAEDMVVAAARSDPRFTPIPSEDFPRLNLSVTVLGEEWPWPAPREPEEIRVGVALGFRDPDRLIRNTRRVRR